jgi:2-iminobutanoate/2-iminopropanoate deaminase
MSRRYIGTNSSRPFSDAVLIDERTLYLSGRIGLKADGSGIPDTVEEEAHRLMQDVQQILASAGMQLEDLVFLQIFSPDVALWAPFNEVYRQYFSGPMPPRSFIGSGPLLFGARFEAQGIAVKELETPATSS